MKRLTRRPRPTRIQRAEAAGRIAYIEGRGFDTYREAGCIGAAERDAFLLGWGDERAKSKAAPHRQLDPA